jgi:hydrophobic/amphiphilic exporter-1 (mainly G- bacteria), HAE1 family
VKLSDISIKRPVFTTMIMLALLVFGMIGFKDIGVDLFPRVEFPVISILSVLPGANPETVETTVSEPIEDALSTISSIKHLRSTSSDNISQVVIEFDLEKNFDVAYQEVQAKLNTIRSELPKDLEDPIIEKFDIDSSPIMSVVVAGKLPSQEISRIADKIVKARLQQIKDVGQIKLIGKQERNIWLYLNPQKLEGYKISTDDVLKALQNHHVEFPGGRITTSNNEITVKTKAEFDDMAGFQSMVIAYRNGSPIRLSDVGKVVDGMQEERSLARLNADKAVALLVRKQSGTNTVAVATALKKEIEKLQKELQPVGVQIEIAQDLSVYIEASIHEIQFHLIFGGLLAVFIVLLFLRNFRITLISATAIPISVIATFALMHAMGFTMNTMTMLALSLAIGILIDDAIVVVENIFRHFKEKGEAVEAAQIGTQEIGLAAFAITMSIVAVFLPVAFMKGIVGRFFYQFGLTVTFAVLISLFVAFTLTPMLSAKFLKKNDNPGRLSKFLGYLLELVDGVYSYLLRGALKFRKITLSLAIITFVCSLFLVKFIRSEFAPMEDQSEFYIKVKTPLGTPLDKTDSILTEISSKIKKEPWVTYTFTTIGSDNLEKVNEGMIYVKMADKHERAISQFGAMQFARDELSPLTSIKTSVEQVPRVSGGGRKATAILLEIKGPNLQKIDEITSQIVSRLKALPGYVDVDSSYEKGKPEIEVYVKRDRAAALGVTPLSIAQTIKTLIGGADLSKFKQDGERYDISVRLQEPFRKKSEDIYRLAVRNNAGDLIALSNLVDVRDAQGPVQIDRHNKAKIITVYANLQEGKKMLGDAVKEISSIVNEMNLAPGYSYNFSGSADAMKDSFANLLFALFLAVIAVYMVLASQFESFIHPFTIMLSIPFSIIGALAGLAITQSTFSIYTIIGIIMLMGLVTKNGILLIDYTNTLRKRDNMTRQDALLKAGPARLHPILMTTFAMIFGMLPIALGTGSGSESRAPMAIAVIGGLITSMFLTLIIVPVVYTLLDDLSAKFSKKH